MMTMRVVAKFYPNSDADAALAKDVLEEFKAIIAAHGGYAGGLFVSERVEDEVIMFEGNYVPQTQVNKRKVVSFDNHVHLDK